MRTGYLECFAGVSGDMMLGALVDAGVPQELLQQTAQSLGLGAELRFTRVDRSGISATKVDVLEGGALAELSLHSHSHEHPPAENGHGHEHPHDHEHGDHEHTAGHSHEHLHDRGHPHEHGLADQKDPHRARHEEAYARVQERVAGVEAKVQQKLRRGASGLTIPHRHDHSPGHGLAAHGHEHSHAHDHSHSHSRGLTEIRPLILNAGLPQDAAAVALRAFELLAQSESKIHNVPVEQIHFHEVGAVDAIVDIVCAAVGLCSLGVDRWLCSPLNVGGGFVECAHGKFPVPAPATADLLRDVPTYSSGIEMELVTPTGAALIRALGCSFGEMPRMAVEKIGYGAGTRDPRRFPNVLRLSIGEGVAAAGTTGDAGGDSFASETITVLECAVDDLSPQVLANCAQLAIDRGALDVMTAPVTMKKGRLGTLLTVLCRQERAAEFQELLFRETSTLGIRVRHEERVYLERRTVEVATEFGVVRVKAGSRGDEEFHAQPEFEDCRRLAEQAGVPLKEVIDAARSAYSTKAEHGAVKA